MVEHCDWLREKIGVDGHLLLQAVIAALFAYAQHGSHRNTT